MVIKEIIQHNLKDIDIEGFQTFAQMCYNRYIVGHLRYAGRGSRWIPKLDKELLMYKQTGNAEHLFNIANYALLENLYPEHPDYHFDPTAKSATRIT